jgi:hypothetical protein
MFTIGYDALTFEIIVMITLNQRELPPYMTIIVPCHIPSQHSNHL